MPPIRSAMHARLDALRDSSQEHPGGDNSLIGHLAQVSPKIITGALSLIYDNTQKAQEEEGRRALRDHPNPELE